MGHSYGEEGRRQAYLAALDIPLWTVNPHHHLVNASEPIVFTAYYEAAQTSDTSLNEVIEPATTITKQALNTSTTPQDTTFFNIPDVDEPPPLEAYLNDPEYQRAAEVDNFVRTGEKLLNASPPIKEKTPIVQYGGEGQAIQFKIAFYGCGAWQLIVPRSQLLSPKEFDLLANIQRVMQTENAPPLLFVWPMVNHYAIPRHKQAAQEALTAFFKNQPLSDKGYIILTDNDEELIALIRQSTPKAVYQQPSLLTLLQHPLKKKDLWLALNQ